MLVGAMCQQDGATPLYISSLHGDSNAVRTLVGYHADVNAARKVCVYVCVWSGEAASGCTPALTEDNV